MPLINVQNVRAIMWRTTAPALYPTFSHLRKLRGTVVTLLGTATTSGRVSMGMGDHPWQEYHLCKLAKSTRPTQPLILSGTGNGPNGDDALWLGSRHPWFIPVVDKNVGGRRHPSLPCAIAERIRGDLLVVKHCYTSACFTLLRNGWPCKLCSAIHLVYLLQNL